MRRTTQITHNNPSKTRAFELWLLRYRCHLLCAGLPPTPGFRQTRVAPNSRSCIFLLHVQLETGKFSGVLVQVHGSLCSPQPGGGMTSFQSILLHWLDQWLTFTLIKSISGHLFSLFTQENQVIGLFQIFEGWE